MTIEEMLKSGMSVEDIVAKYEKKVQAADEKRKAAEAKAAAEKKAEEERESAMKAAEDELVKAFANYYEAAGFDKETITKASNSISKELERNRDLVRPIEQFEVKKMTLDEVNDFIDKIIADFDKF